MTVLNASPGTLLVPSLHWNATSHPRLHLPRVCEVLAVIHTRNSETGVLYRVKSINGVERDIDAGWFVEEVDPLA